MPNRNDMLRGNSATQVIIDDPHLTTSSNTVFVTPVSGTYSITVNGHTTTHTP